MICTTSKLYSKRNEKIVKNSINIFPISFNFRAQEDNERPGSRSSSQMENPGGNNPTTPNNPSMSSSTSGTMYQGKVRTTSAPTSPLKEKKASFFGKVSVCVF